MDNEKKLSKENKQVLRKVVEEQQIIEEYWKEDRYKITQEIQQNYSKLTIIEKY